MHITYLVHGFPPFENAGTEQHTALLAREMKKLGHKITVISATRQFGKLHGEILTENDQGIIIHRIVNNIPALPLAARERRPEIESLLEKLIPKETDVLHIQHTQFLSSHIPFEGPSIWTLHDAWGWCPSGGTLLYLGESICVTPSATDCVRCYANWKPTIPKKGQHLIKLAQVLSPVVPTTFLHRMWQSLPTRIRQTFSQERIAETESPEHLESRNSRFTQLANSCQAIVAPSTYLTNLAQRQGWTKTRTIPHGLTQSPHWGTHQGGAGFVFIGSMVLHKGPQLVSQAYRTAFPEGDPPIHFVGDGPVIVPHPSSDGVPNEQVYELLRHADALIMGSIWQENYPIILLEAKAVGCPIVAPNSGGIPEIVEDGVDGILYNMGDPIDLAKAMKEVLKKSWQTIPPRTSADMSKDYENLYTECIQRSET